MQEKYIMPEIGKSNQKSNEISEKVIEQKTPATMSVDDEQTQMNLLQEINQKLDILISNVGGKGNE